MRVATMAEPTWMPVAAAAAAARSFTGAPASELQVPGLPDQVVAEAVMRLLVDEAIAPCLVNAPRGHEDAIGPERDLPVAHLAGEALALGDEARADAEAARRRLDEQEPELGHGLRVSDEEDRADDLAVLLGHPAALALRIEALDEPGGDLRHHRLESLVEAVLTRVQDGVAVDHPAHVPGLMRPEHVRGLRLRPCAEQALDRAHGLDQPILLGRRQGGEHRADLVARARVQRRKRVVATAGQGEEALAAIGLRAGALEQPPLLEGAHDPAQIAGIETELPPQRARGDGVLMRELVEDAPFGQGERTRQITFVQEA